MAYTFDSLGYAKKLRDSGVPQNQAEAHAEAQTSMDTLSLRLTVRLGAIVVAVIGALAAFLKLT